MRSPATESPVASTGPSAHPGRVTQPAPEHDDYEGWRDLQDVLEERDAEWWAEQEPDDEA